MPQSEIDAAIDQLYQRPLEEFTAARNVLAKRFAADAARIKTLVKPTAAAWAINLLYWQSRPVYDTLVKASEKRRIAHRSALTGTSTDVRTPDQDHRAALRDAADQASAMLTQAGHRPTDLTRQAIAQTLEALPIDAPPGRLTEALQPAGFALLTGLAAASFPAKPSEQKRAGTRAHAPVTPRRGAAEETRRLEQEHARQVLADAQDTLRETEREAKRAAGAQESGHKKLETLKAAAAQAEEAWEAARKSVSDQERDVRRLERDAQTARFNVRDAERRVREAHAKAR